MSDSIEIRVNRLERAVFDMANSGTEALDAIAADARARTEKAMAGAMSDLSATQVASKLNGLERGRLPVDCTHLTMFVDVHGTELYWLVVAWEPDFTGTSYVVDYGCQHVRRKGGIDLENGIRDALESLITSKVWQSWKREDGREIRIGCCMIDANWSRVTNLVYEFCAKPGLRLLTTLLPSRAHYISATDLPFSDHRPQSGEHTGQHWRIEPDKGVLYDTNHWKLFVSARLAQPTGDPGSLSLFGKDPNEHRLLAEHLTAEHCVKVDAHGQTFDEWKLPNTNANHWLDCLVGCAVGKAVVIEYNMRARNYDAEHCIYCKAHHETAALNSGNTASNDYPWAMIIPVDRDAVLKRSDELPSALLTVEQAAANMRQACKTGKPGKPNSKPY